MTPKQLAEKLIELSKDVKDHAEPDEESWYRTEDLKYLSGIDAEFIAACSPDNIQSLCAAYLKAVEALKYIGAPWTHLDDQMTIDGMVTYGIARGDIARKALREMGES